MERRREHRFVCDQPARITELSPSKLVMEGIVKNLSGRGLLLALAQPLTVSTPVRVEFADMLVLGDVCYCRQTGDPALPYAAGVALTHSLYEISALTQLMSRLTAADRRPQPVSEPQS